MKHLQFIACLVLFVPFFVAVGTLRLLIAVVETFEGKNSNGRWRK